MRVQLRIVAGQLRGRKLTFNISGKLRPAPQMLREALFNILGNAVPERPFYDLFAGTGAVGVEAASRGASRVVLVERDFRTAEAIESHLREFGIAGQASVVRGDVYRWVERWPGESEPVNVFLGPPYADFEHRFPDIVAALADLQDKVAPGSVLVVQSEAKIALEDLPAAADWEQRAYGRNRLLLWVKEAAAQ